MAFLSMTPTLLFMYGFVPLGGVAVLIALGLAVRKPEPIKPWGAMLLGGLLLGGTGGFGPSFLEDYGDFLAKISQLDPSSGEAKEAVEQVASDLAEGNVPDEAKALAESILKQTDVPDAESVIDKAMQRATPAGKESLSSVKRALAGRAQVAATEAAGAPAAPVRVPASVDLTRLAPETLRDLNTRSDVELRKLAIDPATLRAAASRAARTRPDR